MAPPAPPAAPAHARSIHDQLTVAVRIRMRPGGLPLHEPTVVDRAVAGPERPAGVRRHRRAVGPERLRRLVPQALVVVLLAGGTAVFIVHDKAVTLDIDGRPRVLHTFADDVGELLDDEGITVGAHDSITPAPHTGLDDGDEVAVRYAAGGGSAAVQRP